MNVMDGKLISAEVQDQVKEEIDLLKEKIGRPPGLSVIIVGDDPASKIYVSSKNKKASAIGVNSELIEFEKDIPEETLIQKIKDLNENDKVDGILVQLPLPDKFETWEILDHMDPEKDVDRFHPLNLGMILQNRATIFPCTPAGIMKMLDYYDINVKGMNAVVVGRSFIVGKPIANMLTNRHATVTICHTRTRDLSFHLKNADLIIAAAGSAGFITEDMVKNDAVLIDVGMNRIDKKEDVLEYCSEAQIKRFEKKGYGLTGDIHIKAFQKSSFYTPVPGGVGLMTVAMLMYNTLQLYKIRNNI